MIRLLDVWPGHFVAGNIDEGKEATLRGGYGQPAEEWHGLFADLTLGDRRIAIVHGHERKH